MRKKRKAINEILIIGTVFFSFLTAACMNKYADFLQYKLVFLITLLGDLILLGGWTWMTTATDRRRSRKDDVFGGIRANLGIIFTVIYTMAVRLPQFDDRPRWDALFYYRALKSACEDFNFTLNSFIRGFALANHPTQGMAGIAAIGEFLNPGEYVGVLVMQLLMNLLMAFCVYRILEKILPRSSRLYITLASCIILSTPLTLGTFSYLQPDAGTVYFFVFVVYCYLFKYNILMFFSMVLLILSKEVGIIILAGFGIGIFFQKIFFGGSIKNIGKRIRKFFKEPLGISGMFAVVCFIIYFIFYLKNGGTVWNISNSGIEGFSTFSFQPHFIVFKCKHFFVLNFNWLIWGGIVIMLLYLCIRGWQNRGFSEKIRHKDILVSVIFVAVALIIFYCSYVTYALPRYHVLVDFCAVWIFVILFAVCISEGKVKSISSCILGFVLLTEAYTTIDPISLMAFENADTGNARIVTERFGVMGQTDFCVYNHQFNYLNKAYSQVLKDVDYYEGMDVLIWDTAADYEIWGNGVYWDVVEQKRTMIAGENTISVKAIERRQIETGETDLQSEAVFVLTPQFRIAEDIAEDYLNKYYELRYKGTVEVPMGGEVTFWVCDLIKLPEVFE